MRNNLTQERRKLMNNFKLKDEEVELLAKALTAYKKDLKNLSKEEEDFALFEVHRSDEIARKLEITKDYYTFE